MFYHNQLVAACGSMEVPVYLVSSSRSSRSSYFSTNNTKHNTQATIIPRPTTKLLTSEGTRRPGIVFPAPLSSRAFPSRPLHQVLSIICPLSTLHFVISASLSRSLEYPTKHTLGICLHLDPFRFLVAIYLERRYFPIICGWATPFRWQSKNIYHIIRTYVLRGVRWGVQRVDSFVGLMLIPYREDSSALGYLTCLAPSYPGSFV